MFRPLASPALLMLFCPLLTAQPKDKERSPAADKAREFAADAMKRAEVRDARLTESARLVVASVLPDAKGKALAGQLDKVYVTASRAIKFDPAEEKTKLVVFVFPELDQYRQFKRSVVKERPDDDESTSFDFRRDEPFVAVAPGRGVRNPNFEALAAAEICKAVLAKKGGNARVPEWMKDGFARAVQMRADPRSVGGDRSAVSRLAPRVPKGATAAPVADRAWTGMGREKDLVAASLMDFLTFGPGAEKFGSVLSAMIPSDGAEAPTFGEALMRSEWMLEDLDRAWREWLGRGSPVAK